VLKTVRPADFVDGRFGLPTVRDIFAELEKPARDPRPAFRTASFAQGVERIEDLKPGMVLEGTVSNVAAFGAFVDVGVHQDGLVHVSQLADRFVKDPSEIVKAGDVVEVRVLEVDLKRKRISLSMRRQDAPGKARRQEREAPVARPPKPQPPPAADGAFGAALSAALARKR
jgi:protein Tex